MDVTSSVDLDKGRGSVTISFLYLDKDEKTIKPPHIIRKIKFIYEKIIGKSFKSIGF